MRPPHPAVLGSGRSLSSTLHHSCPPLPPSELMAQSVTHSPVLLGAPMPFSSEPL